MPVVSSLDHLPTDGEFYSNNCVDGHCIGCGECCTEYKKIPPQYCARCGATFYERKENTFCLQCRFDRKKQAQRHWCRVNAKRGERP